MVEQPSRQPSTARRITVPIGGLIAVAALATATDTVVGPINTGIAFGGVAVTRDGSRVYGAGNSSVVRMIDTATNTLSGDPCEPPASGGGQPHRVRDEQTLQRTR